MRDPLAFSRGLLRAMNEEIVRQAERAMQDGLLARNARGALVLTRAGRAERQRLAARQGDLFGYGSARR